MPSRTLSTFSYRSPPVVESAYAPALAKLTKYNPSDAKARTHVFLELVETNPELVKITLKSSGQSSTRRVVEFAALVPQLVTQGHLFSASVSDAWLLTMALGIPVWESDPAPSTALISAPMLTYKPADVVEVWSNEDADAVMSTFTQGWYTPDRAMCSTKAGSKVQILQENTSVQTVHVLMAVDVVEGSYTLRTAEDRHAIPRNTKLLSWRALRPSAMRKGLKSLEDVVPSGHSTYLTIAPSKGYKYKVAATAPPMVKVWERPPLASGSPKFSSTVRSSNYEFLVMRGGALEPICFDLPVFGTGLSREIDTRLETCVKHLKSGPAIRVFESMCVLMAMKFDLATEPSSDGALVGVTLTCDSLTVRCEDSDPVEALSAACASIVSYLLLMHKVGHALLFSRRVEFGNI